MAVPFSLAPGASQLPDEQPIPEQAILIEQEDRLAEAHAAPSG